MKLKLLTGNGILKIVQANRVKGKKQEYFNIQHGSLDYGLHSYNIHIESKDYDASILNDEFITLTEDIPISRFPLLLWILHLEFYYNPY